MGNYLAVVLQQIDIANNQQIYTAQNATQTWGSTLAFYFTGNISRRPILIVVTFFMGVPADSVAQGCIAAILIYQATSGVCCGQLHLDYHLRGRRGGGGSGSTCAAVSARTSPSSRMATCLRKEGYQKSASDVP
ncbi:hypothetical protein VUR80DRAFT_4481 [Thermomyces stellatus]